MIFHRAIRDYETLCAISALEDEIDDCEALLATLEMDDDPESCRIAHDLRARASHARTLVGLLCEGDAPATFDA